MAFGRYRSPEGRQSAISCAHGVRAADPDWSAVGLALVRPTLDLSPTVLLLMADDLNNDMSVFGHPLVKTPSLERLAWVLAPQDVEVCAVALAEDSFPVREYLAQHAAGLKGVVLSPRLPAVIELELKVLPQTFLVAPGGAVLARWVGAREWDSAAVHDELDRLLEQA